jgi:hypothetical protein
MLALRRQPLGQMTEPSTLHIDRFIKLDRDSIRVQLVVGLVLFVAGIIVMLAGFGKLVTAGSFSLDTITKVGGFLITLVGLFPFNNCCSRWERIKMLRAMKLDPQALDAATTEELVRKLYQKFLGV